MPSLGPSQRDIIQMDVQFQSNIPGIIGRITASQDLILDVAGEEFVNEIRRGIDSRSGHLAESIEELGRTGESGQRTVWVGTRLYYAPWVEHGTLEHTIGPKKARRIAAEAEGKNVAVAAPEWAHPVQEAFHPGASAHPFMRLGKERARRILPQRVGQILRRELGLR